MYKLYSTYFTRLWLSVLPVFLCFVLFFYAMSVLLACCYYRFTGTLAGAFVVVRAYLPLSTTADNKA